jgi:hypothetical protein
MQIISNQFLGHLTYCTNIHAAETWPDVIAELRKHLPEIKAQISPDQPLGVGLRLAAKAAVSLCDPDTFSELQDFLYEGGYYVFTLNGFPYGNFHGQRVKEEAYKPDWADPLRLRYSNILSDHLAQLLPKGIEGSISTVPGTFKPWMKRDPSLIDTIVDNIIQHVWHLVKVYEATGKSINLALEPEPFCMIETIEETVSFFEEYLYSNNALARLSNLSGLTVEASSEALHRHLGVCYDVCHAAVEFEDAQGSLNALKKAGIKISKLQLSSAMRFKSVGPDTVSKLSQMNEPVYMHQVVENRGGKLIRYSDIPEALKEIDAAQGSEWRTHFHVPIFLEEMQNVATTQQFLKDILAIHKKEPVTDQLEVETYTWDVLPESYKNVGISSAISRELSWVCEQLR